MGSGATGAPRAALSPHPAQPPKLRPPAHARPSFERPPHALQGLPSAVGCGGIEQAISASWAWRGRPGGGDRQADGGFVGAWLDGMGPI